MAVGPRAQRYQGRNPIVDREGRPTPEFLRTLNGNVDVVNAIAAAQAAANAARLAADAARTAADGAQDAADAAQLAADNAQATGGAASAEASLQGSYPTDFADPLVAADSTGLITIAPHERVYGNSTLNPTVAVQGATISSAFGSGQAVRVYYDDPDRAGGAVTYELTDDPSIAVQTGDRHSVGAVRIPAAGSQDGQSLRPPGYVEP